MNILALDTSTKKANVGLKIDNCIIDKSIDNEITHSEKLLPLVNDILTENNVSLKNIDCLACSIGPGSFTGIRIGIATVKAFAKVIGVPVFSVSSLDILAYSKLQNSPDYVISIMDAKNNRIYYSIYKVEKDKINDETIPALKNIYDYSNDTIDVALEKIAEKSSNEDLSSNVSLNIVGDCVDEYKEKFIDALHSNVKEINIFNSTLSAKTLIQMANNYSILGINREYDKDYLTLDAVYVRPSQAERAKSNEL